MAWGSKPLRSPLNLDVALRLPLTPPGIEVLGGRKLGPGDVLGCTYYSVVPCSGGRAVAILCSDATSQDGVAVFRQVAFSWHRPTPD